MYFKSCQCDVLKRSTAAIYGHSVYICTCLGRWFSKFYTQQSILCNHFICTIDDILLLLLSRLFKITATLILFWHRALNWKRCHSSLFITVILQKGMTWCDPQLRMTSKKVMYNSIWTSNIWISLLTINIVFSDDAYFVIPYNLVLFFLTRLCKIITVEKILPNLIFVVNWSVALVIPIVLQMF